jgi:hypothetical protein
MHYSRIFYLVLTIFLSIHTFGNITVSSYDFNAVSNPTTTSSAATPANVIASSENKKLNVLGFWFVNSGLNYSDDLVVTRVAFNNFLFDSAEGTIAVDDINMVADAEFKLMEEPLFYPNPFKFSQGAKLHYQLSQAMDIDIHMYDIFGRKIFNKKCSMNSKCGQSGKNTLTFNKQELGGYDMSSGVYFYIFIHNGTVIGRGKVAIVP